MPPYCEACWYEGRTTDKNWAPFFVCGEVGDALRAFSSDNPDQETTVICGHTHHAGVVQIAENQIVYTGAADYGNPSTEGVVFVGDKVAVELRSK